MLNNIIKSLITIGLFASAASATTVYNFSKTTLSARFDSLDNSKDFTFSLPSASSVNSIAYDATTGTATARMTGTGLANGVTTTYEYLMSYYNVIPITNPTGLLGFTGNNASSSGTLKINNVGDITGDGVADNVLLALSAKFMNFASYAGTTHPYQELSGLGNANFFLWDSIANNGITAKSWHMATNLLVNGVNRNGLFTSIQGDMHLYGGSSTVPEPASMLLLGMGVAGGVVRRRKAS